MSRSASGDGRSRLVTERVNNTEQNYSYFDPSPQRLSEGRALPIFGARIEFYNIDGCLELLLLFRITMCAEDFNIYEFGSFRLNVKERLLWREGILVPLTGKAFDILCVLVRNSGHLIKKEELMEMVWPCIAVEDNNLTVNMSAVRKVLGEKRGKNRYIETVSKLGYRFIAAVRKVSDDDQEHKVIWRSGTYIGRERGYQTIDSLAVLPFTVDSKEKEFEYLSDGVAESLINNLSRLPGCRVMARNTVFQFGQYEGDAMAFGQRLGVRAVLTGRMLHVHDSLVVRAELVDSVDGSLIWGEQYTCELSGLLDLQQEISQEISENLRLKLTSEDRTLLARKSTINAEAFRLYLKGRYFWNKYTHPLIERSIEYFQRAIELDPNYALAHAGLAEAYYRLSNTFLPPKEMLPLAKAAALRALKIDETLAEGHVALGVVKLHYDYDWEGAEIEYRRAIELFPHQQAHSRLGVLLLYRGNLREAMKEFELAQEIDPLSLQLSMNISLTFYLMGHPHEAVRRLKNSIEMDPNYHPLHTTLGSVYMHQNKFKEAIASLEEAFRQGGDYTPMAYLAYVHGKQGNRSEAERLLKEMKDKRDQKYISPYLFAVIYTGLGDRESAFEWLEIAYNEHNDWMVWVKVSPELNALHGDARFKDLLSRIGLN